MYFGCIQGINFQLAAVLLSIGVYTYVESGECIYIIMYSVVMMVMTHVVLRYKLSIILKACVLDRPCLNQCNHQNKVNALLINTLHNINFAL